MTPPHLGIAVDGCRTLLVTTPLPAFLPTMLKTCTTEIYIHMSGNLCAHLISSSGGGGGLFRRRVGRARGKGQGITPAERGREGAVSVVSAPENMHD